MSTKQRYLTLLQDDAKNTPPYLPCPVHATHKEDPIQYGSSVTMVRENGFDANLPFVDMYYDSRGRTFEGRQAHKLCLQTCHKCFRKCEKNESFFIDDDQLPYCEQCYDRRYPLNDDGQLLFRFDEVDEFQTGALWINKTSTSSVTTFVIEKVTEKRVHYYDKERDRHCVMELNRFLEANDFFSLPRGSISENRSKQAHFGQAAKQHFVREALDVPYVGPSEDGGPLISILIFHRNEETPIHIQDMVLDSEEMVECCLEVMTLWRNLGNIVFVYEHGNERFCEFRPTNAANGFRFGEAKHPGPRTRRNWGLYCAKRRRIWDLHWQDVFLIDPVMHNAIKKLILCGQAKYEAFCREKKKEVDSLLQFKVIKVKADEEEIVDPCFLDDEGKMYTNFVQVYFQKYDVNELDGRMDSMHSFINYKTGDIFSTYKTNSARIESVGEENLRGNVLENVEKTLSLNGRLIRRQHYLKRPRQSRSPYCLRMPFQWKQTLEAKVRSFFKDKAKQCEVALNVIKPILNKEENCQTFLKKDCVRALPRFFLRASDVAKIKPQRCSLLLKRFLLQHTFDWWNVWLDRSLRFSASWKLLSQKGVYDTQSAVDVLREIEFHKSCFPPVHRPKSAANGKRFGEASNPGPKVVLRFDNNEAVPGEEPTFKPEFKTVDIYLIKSEQQVRHEEDDGDVAQYPNLELTIGEQYMVPPDVHGEIYRRPIDRSGWTRRGAFVEEVHYNAWGTLVRVCRKRARQPKYMWGGSNGAPYCPRNDRNLCKIWKPKRRKKRKPKKYVVEALKRRFLKGDKVYFEVAWAGYEETTEEPRSQLMKDVPLLIEAFESRPKSAANGERFGEASHPGPKVKLNPKNVRIDTKKCVSDILKQTKIHPVHHLVEQFYNPYGIKVRKRTNAEYYIPKCEERFTSPIAFGYWEEGSQRYFGECECFLLSICTRDNKDFFDWLLDIEKELLTAAFNEKTFREYYGLTSLDECFEKARLQSRRMREKNNFRFPVRYGSRYKKLYGCTGSPLKIYQDGKDCIEKGVLKKGAYLQFEFKAHFFSLPYVLSKYNYGVVFIPWGNMIYWKERPKSAANGERFGEASHPGPTDLKRKREQELEAEIRECEARVLKMKREITDLRSNNACLGNRSIEELLDKVTKTTGSMTYENRKYQDVVFRPYDIDRETAIIWSHGKLDLSVEQRDFKDNYNYVVSRGVQPFTVLPKSIGTGTLIKSLKHLTLNFNVLEELPDAIGNLSVLEEFYMCGTREERSRIKSLPSSIVKCQMLETIVISYTELDSLPMNFGVLGNLTYLGLENNRLRSLPDSIQKLHKLRYLNIESNELTHLPEFDERSNLEEIIAYKNKLTKDSFPASIAKLKQLKKLNIAYNDIREFPNALIQLQRSLPKLWIYHKIKIAARGQVWKRRQGGYYAVILGKDENHLHLLFVSATGEWKSMWKPVTEVSEERRFLLSEFLDKYEYEGQFDGSRWKYMGAQMHGVVRVRLKDDNKVRFGKEEFDREYLYEIKSCFLIRAIFVSAPDVYEKII